jgi:hypothetical protein
LQKQKTTDMGRDPDRAALITQHAEIQLTSYLKHHRLESACVEKYIGCSRRACYTCYAFTKGLGYSTQGSHGIVFPWCDFGAEHEASARERGIIDAMSEALAKELGNGSVHLSQDPFQAQPYHTPENSPTRATFGGPNNLQRATSGSKAAAVSRSKTSALSAKNRQARKLEAKKKKANREKQVNNDKYEKKVDGWRKKKKR